MIRVLMWKEYREHRAIWLTLAFVSGAGLYGLSFLLGPVWGLSYRGAHDSLQSVAVLFAWTYGLVSGAMLLANENEAGTMTFLDMLPVQRIQLWLVKCSFGLLLLLAQLTVLTSVVLILGIVESATELILLLALMLFFGLFSLSWSLLFSARGENVLNVIGLAFVGQIAGVVMTFFLILVLAFFLALIWIGHGGGLFEQYGLLGFGALVLTVTPAFGSARLFTDLDRERRRLGSPRSGLRKPARMTQGASWFRVLWLSVKQMRRLMLGMTIFALMLGCFLPVIGPIGWPALTLVIGVLCGVTVWTDEQLSGSFRFLGDQRVPLGRVWIVKVGTRWIMALFAALILLLPSLILALIHRFSAPTHNERFPFFADLLHSSLVGPVVPVLSHLFLWLLYGFTAGQLCGMLFRKSLVAGVVALGSASMLVSLWVPSMLGIGLHFWQVAGVPLFLLVAGWLLMPAWAADRLLTRGTFVRLGLALLAGGLWAAGGLWYRIAEIPDEPEPFNLPAFINSIPQMDKGKNDAGLTIRATWNDVEKMVSELDTKSDKPLFEGLLGNNVSFDFEIRNVLERGWPNRASELGNWLDRKFEKEWYCSLLEVAYQPVGVVEDAKQLNFFELDRLGKNWTHIDRLNQILAARGLQCQAAGDHWTFLNNLRISLALSRNLQHRAPPWIASAGRRAEMIGVRALDRWLEKLPNYPELLEEARDILLYHERHLPHWQDPDVASYLIAHNTLDQVPEKVLEQQIIRTSGMHVYRELGRPEQGKAETEAAALFWRIPWEHERHLRILRSVFGGGHSPPRTAWNVAAFTSLWQRGMGPINPRDLALLHAAELKVALRLYQARNHEKLPEEKLDVLVPRYLPAVPVDPFDVEPFRYRVSKGEILTWFHEDFLQPQPMVHAAGGGVQPRAVGRIIVGAPLGLGPPKYVPPGQAILWSVDEDKRDGGGKHHHGLRDNPENPDPDLIYLVPPPPHWLWFTAVP